jgi:NAD(P)-dependent dehydrogenase (short-subunit alcohol dehydrogenase family)
MPKHLEGRSAIVTGAGRGIGRAVALELARQGAKVLVNDPGVGRGGEATAERPADDVVTEITKAGGTAMANYDSVADYKKAGAMVEACAAKFGSVDILVNVAGVLRERMIWNMTEEDFDLVVAVHLKGHWNMSHHAIKHMRANGFGRLIHFSSDAFKGSMGQCNYGAAKAGIIGLSRSIAKEAAKFGITSNAMCPAADTRMTLTEEVMANRRRRLAQGLITQAEYDRSNIPRGPEHVAPLVAYLCTNEAYWINAEVFHVEKGRIHNYYFGEVMKKLYKDDDDESLFTVDELLQKIPDMMKGVPAIVPPVKMEDAQKQAAKR